MRPGDIVRATAGKDRGKVFLVLRSTAGMAYIANGRRRKVQRPKGKSEKHLCLIAQGTLPVFVTNQTVRNLLRPFYTQHKEET